MALKGIRVVEMAGLAPSPMCGMILADLGASVVRVDRATTSMNLDVCARGKRSLAVDLKTPQGREVVRKLCARSDVLIDPFRPGVMEKLGLGPRDLETSNQGLVYARLTGFGQTGPRSHTAGHDINYLAASGVLSCLGREGEGPPRPPVNLLADFAGGSFVCALGIVASLYERSQGQGRGQVVDCSMVEGAAYVGSWLFRSKGRMYPPLWSGGPRGTSLLDGGSHRYDTYETKDGGYVAVGALEPQFYQVLLDKLGLSHLDDDDDAASEGSTPYSAPGPKGEDRKREAIGRAFLTRTRSEWAEVFEGTDACVTPVLELQEAHLCAHNSSRNSFVGCRGPEEREYFSPVSPLGSNLHGLEGCLRFGYQGFEPFFFPFFQAPAPRLSRTPSVAREDLGEPEPGAHTSEVLQELGYKENEIHQLLEAGVVSMP